MDRIPSPYRRSVRKPGAVSKALITLSSLTTITLLIFAGSRDWKSDKTVSAILSDASDIRNLAGNVVNASVTKATTTQPKASQTSLISQGVLLERRNDAGALPAGMVTAATH